jgi:hypothetical protein
MPMDNEEEVPNQPMATPAIALMAMARAEERTF